MSSLETDLASVLHPQRWHGAWTMQKKNQWITIWPRIIQKVATKIAFFARAMHLTKYFC